MRLGCENIDLMQWFNIHEVKYSQICPSSSNDKISAPQNKMLSQHMEHMEIGVCYAVKSFLVV